MLYIYWVVILGDRDIKKISFENFQFSAARGEKLHQQVVYLSLASLGLVAAILRHTASTTVSSVLGLGSRKFATHGFFRLILVS